MTEGGGESEKEGTVLRSDRFTAAPVEGRGFETRSSLAMAALEGDPLCVHMFPGQGTADPLLPVSDRVDTLSQPTCGTLPPPPPYTLLFILCLQHQLANEPHVSFTTSPSP